MRLVFRVIILFLILFNFRIPVVYNSTALSLVLCAIYYVFFRKSIPFGYFRKKYVARILIGLGIVCFFCFSIGFIHDTFEFTLLKVLTLQFFMLICLVFALPVLIDEMAEDQFQQAIRIVCYVFALQGFIQLTGFLVPSFGKFMISIKPENIQLALQKSYSNIDFRGYALAGNPFFELPSGFGVAFILFFRGLLIRDQKIFNRFEVFVIFFLFSVGAIFSGRTAFVGLSVGLGMAICIHLFLLKQIVGPLIKFLRWVFISSLLLMLGYHFALTSGQRNTLVNHVFPFAFEFYYNYETKGEITTASTEVMAEDHYFALPGNTLLHGDGRYLGTDGTYYQHTDAGYMRTVLFGGIPFFLLLLFYQSCYFFDPLMISKREDTQENMADLLCFLALFLHLFILEYKADTIGTQNIMEVLLLFIGASYMERHYSQPEMKIIQ